MQRVDRKWGYYEEFSRTPTVVFKHLHLRPGEHTSLQRHLQRSEVWFLLSGKGEARTGWEPDYTFKEELKVGPQGFPLIVLVPGSKWHQLINTGEEELVVAEVQFGSLCSEEDIERYQEGV